MPIKKIKQLKEKFAPQGSFKANVLTLAGGTAIAQAVVLLTAPILTRMNTPQEFGEFALFISFISTLSVIATGSYQLAINLPHKEEDAFYVFLSVIVLTLLFSILSLLIVMIGYQKIASFFNVSVITLFLIPIGIILVGCFEAFNYWLIRLNKFGNLAFRRVIQFTVMVVMQIWGGMFHWGALGLIGGYLGGQLAAYSFLGVNILYASQQKPVLEFSKLKQQLIRYKDFPFFFVPSRLVNVCANQAPNFIVNHFLGQAMLGFFTLPMRYLDAPVALIARSVLDVFKERASRDYRERGECFNIYLKTLKTLALFGIVPFAIIFIVSPMAVPYIFGSEWKFAGQITQILTILFYFRFVGQPLSYIFVVTEKQRANFVWQSVLLFVVILAFYAGGVFHNMMLGVTLFSLGYSLMYVWLIVWGFRLSKGK